MTRWGILGTGEMAATLVPAIREAGGEVAAVASRSGETAQRFAGEHGVESWYGSYRELAEESGVDVVYVSSTNQRHRADTIMCLEAGRAVLCEKPVALNAPEAAEMANTASARGAFLMEAMWMTFQPSVLTLERLLAEGVIGPVHHLQVDFGFPADLDPRGRFASPELGGGALLDVGVYPLTLAHSLLGRPDRFETAAVLGPTGVDLQVGVISVHGDVVASMSASLLADTALEAVVSGPEGRLRLHAPFHHSPRVTLHRGELMLEAWDRPVTGSPYRFEVEEVHRCLDAGVVESDRRPLTDTLEVMRWMDEIRERIGVTYPGE